MLMAPPRGGGCHYSSGVNVGVIKNIFKYKPVYIQSMIQTNTQHNADIQSEDSHDSTVNNMKNIM